jgi:hypothetical protein
MFLIFQIAGGLLIVVGVLAWWRELGAITMATMGSGLLLLVAASVTWHDLMAVNVIAVTVAGAVWLGARYEALEWDEAEDELGS